MKLWVFFIAAFVSIVVAHAATDFIDYDKVEPFTEPEPVTDVEKAAIKFKPQLVVTYECVPYPAVNANGSISDGLRFRSYGNRACLTPALGSQVYSRADWYDGKYAIMYAWYFPRALLRPHYWKWAIVWIDDPALEDSAVLGVSMSAPVGYRKRAPPKEKYLNGPSVKLKSYVEILLTGDSALKLTTDKGEKQDLIQWHQLTDAARDNLSTVDFDESLWNMARIKCPLKDDVFDELLRKSSPFS